MSKKIIYVCNHCGKVLSDGAIASPHLSIDFGYQSGWVSEHHVHNWKHDTRVSGICHFCGSVCLKKFFDGLKPKKLKK